MWFYLSSHWSPYVDIWLAPVSAVAGSEAAECGEQQQRRRRGEAEQRVARHGVLVTSGLRTRGLHHRRRDRQHAGHRHHLRLKPGQILLYTILNKYFCERKYFSGDLDIFTCSSSTA